MRLEDLVEKEDPKANIRRWVEALRSGRYKQGREALHAPDRGFCCLGVACDLYKEAHPEYPVVLYQGDFVYGYEDDKSSSVLPFAVCNWLGLESSNPTIFGGGAWQSLAELNDHSMPFSSIADLIEAQFLK